MDNKPIPTATRYQINADGIVTNIKHGNTVEVKDGKVRLINDKGIRKTFDINLLKVNLFNDAVAALPKDEIKAPAEKGKSKKVVDKPKKNEEEKPVKTGAPKPEKTAKAPGKCDTIYLLFKHKGKTKEEIRELIGCTSGLVSNVIRDYESNEVKQNRVKQIHESSN
jgi:hypothetical protein